MKSQTAKLGTEKIPKLLVDLSVPAMIGMLVMGLYNVVDTIFVARGVGTLAVAGLSIVFPIQMIVGAFAMAVGIGGASIISRVLGKGDTAQANLVFGHVVWLLMILSFMMIGIALFWLEPLLVVFGASKMVMPYAKEYSSVILMGSVSIMFAMGTTHVVRAEGNSNVAMLAMVLGAILNIILTPIFIFGLDMGVRGSALATVIAQLASFVWLMIYFRRRSTLTYHWVGFLPKLQIVKEIAKIGIPVLLQAVSTNFLIVVINWMLLLYGGDIYIAIVGMVHKLMMFVLLPVQGIVQGMQPILGYNFGANQHTRVSDTMKLSIGFSTLVTTVAWIMTMFFSTSFISIFSSDSQIIHQGATALRFIFLCGPLMIFPPIVIGFYQALGNAKKAFALPMIKNLIFFLLLLLMPYVLGSIQGVWWSFVLVDIFAFLLAVFLLYVDRELLFPKSFAD